MDDAVLPVDAVSPEVLAEYTYRANAQLPPADAQEYLWRVRHEAAALPDVTAVAIASLPPPAPTTIHDIFLPDLLPFPADRGLTAAQAMEITSDFADVRQYLVHVETSYSIPRTMVVPKLGDEDGWRKVFASTPPHVRTLVQMDQIMTRRLLHTMLHWLEDDDVDVPALSRLRAVWLYALLARLDKPLLADMDACVRDIFRWCWRARSLAPSTANIDALNAVLCICGFFGQGE